MATELAKAYVQIVPSAEGITGSIASVLGDEATSSGTQAGKNIASSLAKSMKTALVGLGLGKIISDAISSGSEFQTSLAKLGTIADTSAVSLDDLGAAINEMSSEMGISQADLAEAAYSTISATGDTANALDLVAQAAKLATSGFTDTDSAISVLTTALNAYGLSADQVEHISDSLITTQNLGVTTVADLAANMGRAIATASGYGVSLENLEAAYISTTKAGIGTAESTTYLSSMMNELGKGGSAVSDILLEHTGKSFGQLMADGATLADVLGVVMESVDGNSEAFMNLWGSQEAGKGANAIVNQGLETFNANLGTLTTQIGTTEAAYGQMTDTASWKTQDLRTKVENLGIQLFSAMYPTLVSLTEQATLLVSSLDMEAIGQSIQTMLSAITPLIQLAGQLLSFVAQNLDTIIPLLTTIIGFSVGQKIAAMVPTILSVIKSVSSLSGVISALGGPAGIIISLVAAAVAGLVTLYMTNEDFRTKVQRVWKAVQTVFETVWGAIKVVVETVFNAIKWYWENILRPVFDAIGAAVQFMLKAVTHPLETMRKLFDTVFNGIKRIVSPIVEWLKGVFNFKWELPKIKLPHFTIKGSFSLTPPSVPSFGISWYAKAMNQPYILNQPTLFGAGEAGDEMVYGRDSLMEDIERASGGQDELQEILTLLKSYLPDSEAGITIGNLSINADSTDTAQTIFRQIRMAAAIA